MGPPADGQPFAILLALVAASSALVVLGFVLRRRGMLASRGAALGWAVFTMVPIFGAGALMYARHTVDSVTGVTEPGVNEEPNRDPRDM